MPFRLSASIPAQTTSVEAKTASRGIDEVRYGMSCISESSCGILRGGVPAGGLIGHVSCLSHQYRVLAPSGVNDWFIQARSGGGENRQHALLDKSSFFV